MTTIKLAPITVHLVDSMGSDEQICRAARVSTLGTDSAESHVDARLINYLMQHRHGSPFEHGAMTLLVQVPIFVAREWMRHRIGWSYNEVSSRYRQMEPEFFLPHRSRNLVQTGKVGDYTFVPGSPAQYLQVEAESTAVYQAAWDAYLRLKDAGVANEVARNVLPLGLMTSFYATCNPRSAMAFLSLRTERASARTRSTPLHEIDVAATLLEAHFEQLFPLTYAAFESNGRVAP